jgi:hypothetical protein
MKVELPQFHIGIRSGVLSPHPAFDQFLCRVKIIQRYEDIIVHVEDHLGLVLFPDLIQVKFGLSIGSIVVIELGKFQVRLAPTAYSGGEHRRNNDPIFSHMEFSER